MRTQTRDALYALAALGLSLLIALALVMATGPAHAKGKKDPKPGRSHADVDSGEGKWPAPIVAGGAMPVQWTEINGPSPLDSFGLYTPEMADGAPLAWLYTSCSQTPGVALATGTCGFIIPATIPPGTYEIRLFSGATGQRLSKSPKFEVVDGGWK